MQRTLVTVIGSRRSVDLDLPADIPVQSLMPMLLSLCEELTPEQINLHLARWGLGVLGDMPLHPQHSLSNAGVVDGARLLLHALGSWGSHSAPIAQLTGAHRITARDEHQGIGIHWNAHPSH